ncbi:FCD domain-containing protein [Conexibacter stalactiti]|uniref:FCD domain-containing protein n=1 Tax=Conexibacter stalactiti TaxID=1940611 RepID=A0ABU4HL77_9ACTN|nr:FCD domain-containing protein [Conexibacter stalactiti]MDW5594054.1 FCD domain-containing protein [Conexibacter stalactiti]MEC5034696.1 FCD domain-containing protein [Conexibacter stalactiti]
MTSSDLTAPRISRAEMLARQLEQDILDSSLPPGHRLGTKEDLRTRFRVAVGTVNEAIRSLEMRGLVEARPGPGGGVFVATPSPHVRLSHFTLGFRNGGASFADCLAVRNSLELLVATEAARYATDDDLAELREIVASMADDTDDPRAFLRRNWTMHRRMAEVSPNSLLTGIYSALLDIVENELDNVELDATFDVRASIEVHRELVDAVESRDATRIAEAVRRHEPTTETAPSGPIAPV